MAFVFRLLSTTKGIDGSGRDSGNCTSGALLSLSLSLSLSLHLYFWLTSFGIARISLSMFQGVSNAFFARRQFQMQTQSEEQKGRSWQEEEEEEEEEEE